jgi:hypothetical protein
LVFVMYGLTIRSIFFLFQHTRRETVYVWIAFPLWSIFICSVLAVFAIEYDLLPHTSGPSISQGRPVIDYFYYETIREVGGRFQSFVAMPFISGQKPGILLIMGIAKQGFGTDSAMTR